MTHASFLPLAAAFTLLASSPAHAQSTMQDMLSDKTPLTFIGLDFSEAKFVARYEFPGLDKQGTMFFVRWNALLQTEWAKYNLAEPLQLGNVPTLTQFVQEVNDRVDVQKAWATGDPVFDKERIPAMVKKYKTEGEEGMGCVFIVGSFNKTLEKGEFFVTFFDMKTKEVVHTERMVGKPFGFGERNFWAGAVTNVLEDIKKTYRNTWEQKFPKG
ncbi:MAG: hypothetical protein ABI599_04885 [Flavobacteriales bacterium]